MRMQTLVTQIRRELWENKTGLISTPLWVTGLVLVLGVAALLYSSSDLTIHNSFSNIHFNCSGDACAGSGDEKITNAVAHVTKDSGAFREIVLSAMYSNCILLSLVLSIVVSTYILRCLHEDRDRKDILFWRSMPVSETTNVLVKLAVQILAAPLIMFAINLFMTCVFIAIGILLFTAHGISFGYLIDSITHESTVFVPLQIFYENVFGMLMLMPIIGYCLFASALAKRSPFVTAALIPIVLVLIEKIFKMIAGVDIGILNIFGWYFHALYDVKAAYILREAFVFNQSMIIPFVVCVTVGGVFVAAAIWLRNNRYEI